MPKQAIRSVSQRHVVTDALNVWAPTYPRRVSRRQWWADDREEAIEMLFTAEDEEDNEPFISTYAFPRGHSKNNNIPEINTLFIDFDIESGDYEPGSGDREAWRSDMAFLLRYVRQIATMIQERGATGWRASLSGHKGIHLFLDFPTLPATLGTFEQYLVGLRDYSNTLIGHIIQETGIDDLRRYVDVTSSDLGRLHRVPNTLHQGAIDSFDEPRYCIPVTIEELTYMTPELYEEMVSEPRSVPYGMRNPNETAGETIRQHVQNADAAYEFDSANASTLDYSRVKKYVEHEQNNDIELCDVPVLTSDRPCVWKFHENDEKFRHGAQSHFMELFAIREMVENNVPVDVIHEFFANVPEYDEDWTNHRIEEVIARDYNKFNVETLHNNAPRFCNLDGCRICERIGD